MENNTFAPRLHIVYLKRMFVSAAACAPANRAKQNFTWHSKFLY